MSDADYLLVMSVQVEAPYENMEPCWIWLGAKGWFGYGKLKRNGRIMPVHRFSYEIYVGPIPAGLLVLHKCDVPSCINPSHLWIGTSQDNTADKTAKGRVNTPIGERNGSSVLTADMVVEARRLRNLRGPSSGIVALSKKFGVGVMTMHDALTGKTWKHV